MTQNKQTVAKYMEGFREGNHEKILSCLTDDVIWELPGHYMHHGKEAFDKEIENENFEGRPAIQIIRYIEENDIVVAEGKVQCRMKNGTELDIAFCDVFNFENGKIKKLTSYLMTI